MNNDCLFCKIAAGSIPSKKVYEDDEVLAFHDIHPIAPVHFLIIPKEHMDSLTEAESRHQALLGKLPAAILQNKQSFFIFFYRLRAAFSANPEVPSRRFNSSIISLGLMPAAQSMIIL